MFFGLFILFKYGDEIMTILEAIFKNPFILKAYISLKAKENLRYL